MNTGTVRNRGDAEGILKRGIFVTGFLCCISSLAAAFSVNDIPQTNDNRIRELVVEVAKNERYCDQWYKDWAYQIPRDSISEQLHSIVLRADELSRKSMHRYELAMLKAVTWHHLYQLEVDSAFHHGKQCIQDAFRNDPAAIETAWLKGVHLIKASFISDGFETLDSLRQKVPFNRNEFLLDYAKLSALCFLPENHRYMDTLYTIGTVLPRSFPVYLSQQEQLPVYKQWSVSSEIDNGYRASGYSFTAKFSLGKDIALSFPGLKSSQKMTFRMRIPPDIASRVPEPSVPDPFVRNHDARISVKLNPLTEAQPLWNYMKQLTTDGFDVVEQRQELEHLGAISLRCKMRSPFRNVTDRTYAFIAFNRKLPQSVYCFYKSPKIKLPQEKYTYRYRIGMECRGIVRNKAEKLL